jgi:hypothetical protein
MASIGDVLCGKQILAQKNNPKKNKLVLLFQEVICKWKCINRNDKFLVYLRWVYIV